MSDTIVITNRSARAFFLRPEVVVAACGDTTVARADWEEWLAANSDSPLLSVLKWPGRPDDIPLARLNPHEQHRR
jgi:hypothetical protein